MYIYIYIYIYIDIRVCSPFLTQLAGFFFVGARASGSMSTERSAPRPFSRH